MKTPKKQIIIWIMPRSHIWETEKVYIPSLILHSFEYKFFNVNLYDLPCKALFDVCKLESLHVGFVGRLRLKQKASPNQEDNYVLTIYDFDFVSSVPSFGHYLNLCLNILVLFLPFFSFLVWFFLCSLTQKLCH